VEEAAKVTKISEATSCCDFADSHGAFVKQKSGVDNSAAMDRVGDRHFVVVVEHAAQVLLIVADALSDIGGSDRRPVIRPNIIIGSFRRRCARNIGNFLLCALS